MTTKGWIRVEGAKFPKPRSKTFLNGSGSVLVASPGIEIALVAAEGEETAAPNRVMLFPAGQIYEVELFNFAKEKIEKYRAAINREWLEKLRANTINAWGMNPLPIYLDHIHYDEARGWFNAAGL